MTNAIMGCKDRHRIQTEECESVHDEAYARVNRGLLKFLLQQSLLCLILAQALLSSCGLQSQLLHFPQKHSGINYDFYQRLKHLKASVFS